MLGMTEAMSSLAPDRYSVTVAAKKNMHGTDERDRRSKEENHDFISYQREATKPPVLSPHTGAESSSSW